MRHHIDELSKEKIEFYKKNGYLLLKNFFTEEETIQYKETCRKISLKNNSFSEPGDLMSHKGLDKLVYDARIVKILTQLWGEKPVYFGDSGFAYGKDMGKGRHGIHTDTPNDPTGPFSERDYFLIRCVLYPQDHINFSGGLKVQPKTHKRISLHQYFRLIAQRIKRKLFKQEPLFKEPIPFPSYLPYVNLRGGIGDLVLWDERLIHSGWFCNLKRFPNFSFYPRIENYIHTHKGLHKFFLKPPINRTVISINYGLPSKELDSYMKHLGTRKDYLEHWQASQFSDPEKQKLLHDNGIEVKTDCLKHAGVN